MAGEVLSGVAVFMIILIVLVGGWLSSKFAKESGHVAPERVPVVGDRSVLKSMVDNPPKEEKEAPVVMPRKPLKDRVQIVKARPTTSGGRQDTAYNHPVIDTYDYSEPSRSRDCGGGNDYSSGSDSSSSSCD